MKNEIKVQTRTYTVKTLDRRTGEGSVEILTLDKQQLQAAQIVGLDSNSVVRNIFGRHGYKVLEISKLVKKELVVDLTELYGRHLDAKVQYGGDVE